jgi:hypothetical protein
MDLLRIWSMSLRMRRSMAALKKSIELCALLLASPRLSLPWKAKAKARDQWQCSAAPPALNFAICCLAHIYTARSTLLDSK